MSNDVGTGTHRGFARGAWLTESSQKKTPGLCIELEASEGPFKGARSIYTGWLTDASLDRTIESARACGWTGQPHELATTLDTIRGECEFVVEEETYQKKDGTEGVDYRVKWINDLNRPRGPKRMDAQDAAALAKRLAKRIAASDRARAEADKGEGNPL